MPQAGHVAHWPSIPCHTLTMSPTISSNLIRSSCSKIPIRWFDPNLFRFASSEAVHRFVDWVVSITILFRFYFNSVSILIRSTQVQNDSKAIKMYPPAIKHRKYSRHMHGQWIANRDAWSLWPRPFEWKCSRFCHLWTVVDSKLLK